MTQQIQMYINGEWVQSANRQAFEDYNPATGQLFAEVASGEAQDMRRAIDAACNARQLWIKTPPAQKGVHLRRAADLLENNQAAWAETLVEESGSTFGKAMFEVQYSAGLLREAAAQVHQVTGEILASDTPDKFYMVLRQPVGVVGVISPWNFPLLLSLRGVAFAMAYGNTIVLKPSSETPISGGTMIGQVFEQAGLPPGVLNVVTCPHDSVEETGDALIRHPGVRRISFTGSTETGRHLAEKAGRYLKRMVLELGGKNALIVLKDADLDYAVNAAAFGSFFHQGQICMSVERIIAEEPIAATLAQKLAHKAQGLQVGDPHDPHTVIGPIINPRQLEMIRGHVEEALSQGARLLCGGKHDGPFYYPTVLADVTPEMNIFREETFGPVVSVVAVGSAEAAVQTANDSAYGLAAGVITADLHKGLELAERIESGIVHINDATVHDEPHCPFGGVKGSGIGRHGGKASIEEFTEQKWVSIQRAPRAYPF